MQRRIDWNSGGTGHQGWHSRGERAAAGKARGAALAAALLLAGAEGLAQGKPGDVAAQEANPETARHARQIVVSIPDRKLALVEDGRVVKVYRVATGARVSPSPAGEFTIAHRIPEPTYYAPGVVIPPGPGNPLGTRWIGLT